MIPDWVDNYIDNEGYDSKNHAFGFTSSKIEYGTANNLKHLLIEVIRQISSKEKELSAQNFRLLKITVVNEYCFNTIKRLQSKKDSKYDYIILLPEDSITNRNEELVKHKIAHELAHFLFSLQNRNFDSSGAEEIVCNQKAVEWGFPEPQK